jgi:hypothetical protein
MTTATATADKASLQVIGFVLASITAGIILVAGMLVHASAKSDPSAHQPQWQVARTSGLS